MSINNYVALCVYTFTVELHKDQATVKSISNIKREIDVAFCVRFYL